MVNIETAIRILEQKATEIQEQLHDLRNAKSIMDSLDAVAPMPVATSSADKPTRREQLVAFLRKHGPLRAAEIEQRTHIPAGTLARLLADKSRFRSDGGRWAVFLDEERRDQREREVEQGIAEKSVT